MGLHCDTCNVGCSPASTRNLGFAQESYMLVSWAPLPLKQHQTSTLHLSIRTPLCLSLQQRLSMALMSHSTEERRDKAGEQTELSTEKDPLGQGTPFTPTPQETMSTTAGIQPFPKTTLIISGRMHFRQRVQEARLLRRKCSRRPPLG